MKMRIYAAGLTLFCLLTLSGCANVQPSPEVLLTVNGCPRVTQCRLEKSAARTNGDLLTALDEAEAAWAVSCGVSWVAGVAFYCTSPVTTYRVTLRVQGYGACTTTVDAIRHKGAANEDHTTGADTGPD